MNKLFDRIWHQWLRLPYRLSCTIDEGSGPSVVLLHGIGVDASIWKHLVKLLIGRPYRIVAPDLLGFGASPKPDWPRYSTDDHARTVLDLLKSRQVRPPYVLVGHSMGCLIAAHIAREHPKLVKQLILYEPPLFADHPDFRSHRRRRAVYFAAYEWLAKRPGLLTNYGHALGRTALSFISAAASDETWLPFERSLRNTIMKQAAYRDMHKVTVPTLIIHGRLDMIVTRAELKKMFGSNPYISFETIPTRHSVSPRAARFLAQAITESSSGA